MLFNADCLTEAYEHIKPTLSQLIIDGTIKTQYELDQIIRWVSKEIKFNKDINK